MSCSRQVSGVTNCLWRMQKRSQHCANFSPLRRVVKEQRLLPPPQKESRARYSAGNGAALLPPVSQPKGSITRTPKRSSEDALRKGEMHGRTHKKDLPRSFPLHRVSLVRGGLPGVRYTQGREHDLYRLCGTP